MLLVAKRYVVDLILRSYCQFKHLNINSNLQNKLRIGATKNKKINFKVKKKLLTIFFIVSL